MSVHRLPTPSKPRFKDEAEPPYVIGAWRHSLMGSRSDYESRHPHVSLKTKRLRKAIRGTDAYKSGNWAALSTDDLEILRPLLAEQAREIVFQLTNIERRPQTRGRVEKAARLRGALRRALLERADITSELQSRR